MAKTKRFNEIPTVTDLTGAKIVGLDKDGKDASFPIADIVRSQRGLATPTGTPTGTRFAGETWLVSPSNYGSTFTNFGGVNIPIKVGAQYVANARIVYNNGGWTAQYELVDGPTSDAKVEQWNTAAAYSSGKQVYNNGIIYEAATSVTAGQEPGVVATSIWKPITKSINVFGLSVSMTDTIQGNITTAGAPGNLTSYNRTGFIAVEEGQRLDYVIRSGNISIFFYNASQQYIDGAVRPATDGSTETMVGSLYIPTGVRYIRAMTINNTHVNWDAAYVFSIKIAGVVQDVIGNREGYAALNAQLLENQSISLDNTGVGSLTVNGAGASGTTFNKTDLFPISPGMELEYSVRVAGNGQAAIYFFDETKMIAKAVSSTTVATLTGKLIVPPKTKSFRVMTMNSTNTSYQDYEFYVRWKQAKRIDRLQSDVRTLTNALAPLVSLSVADLLPGNITSSGGDPTESISTYSKSAYLPIQEGELIEYTLRNGPDNNLIFFYNENKGFLSAKVPSLLAKTQSGSLIAPAGAKLMRLMTMNSSHTLYEPYTFKFQYRTVSVSATGDDTKQYQQKTAIIARTSAGRQDISDAGGSFSFLHYGDIHYSSNLADANLAELIEFSKNPIVSNLLSCIICSGDVSNGDHGRNKASTTAEIQAWSTRAVTSLLPHYNVIGNHDEGYSWISAATFPDTTIANAYSKQEQYNLLLKPLQDKWNHMVTVPGKMYYHSDFPSKKIRIIGLDCYDYPDFPDNGSGSVKYDAPNRGNYYSQAQLDWLNTTLLNTPADYGVIIINHAPVDDDTSVGKYIQGPEMLPAILDAFSKGTSYSKTFTSSFPELSTSKTFNFSTKGPGEFICFVSGHIHFMKITSHPSYPNLKCIVVPNMFTRSYGRMARHDTIPELRASFAFTSVERSTRTISITMYGAYRDSVGDYKEQVMYLKY